MRMVTQLWGAAVLFATCTCCGVTAQTLEEQLERNDKEEAQLGTLLNGGQKEQPVAPKGHGVAVRTSLPPGDPGPDYPTGTYATCWQPANEIGCFTHMDKVFPMR